MTLPRITASELLQRWQGANELSWEDKSIGCVGCGAGFQTGDVNFTYPPIEITDETPAIVSRLPGHRCVTCAWGALSRGLRFDGIGLFVEKAHQGSTIDELPRELREKILESFTLIDRLATELEAASRGKAVEPS